LAFQKNSAIDLKYAKENNLSIKLVARAFKQDGKLFAFVIPQYIPNNHMLATVRNEYNAVWWKVHLPKSRSSLAKALAVILQAPQCCRISPLLVTITGTSTKNSRKVKKFSLPMMRVLM